MSVTPMNERFAEIIKNAMKIREASYDKAAANAASIKADAERAADPGNIYAGAVDYNQFYRKTMREAAEEAAEQAGVKTVGEPVYYLLTGYWNDIEAWVNEQL